MPEHVNLVSAGSHEDVEEAAAAAGCNGSQSLFSSATRSANRCFKRSFGLLAAIAMALDLKIACKFVVVVILIIAVGVAIAVAVAVAVAMR